MAENYFTWSQKLGPEITSIEILFKCKKKVPDTKTITAVEESTNGGSGFSRFLKEAEQLSLMHDLIGFHAQCIVLMVLSNSVIL